MGKTKAYSSRELIKLLEEDGWSIVRINSSHHHLHPKFKRKIVVPHPKKYVSKGILYSILKFAGLEEVEYVS